MSGIAKAIKKVWRPIEKLASKVTNVATLGLHNKTKKIRHKIIKSKIFKVVVAVVAIYFGGAALLSMMGGGTAAAGVGSAWAGVQGAGSAIAAGNVGGAVSALGTGFTGGAAAGAGAGFTAGQAATAGTIAADAAAVTAGTTAGAGTAAINTAEIGSTAAGYSPETMSAFTAGGGGGGTTASGGLLSKAGDVMSGAWNSLGSAGKGAVITSGINMAGQAMQGNAEQEAAEEAARKRTYWGLDGDGNYVNQNQGGLLSFAAPKLATPPANASWQTTLDDLINKQKQVVGGYGG